MSKKRKSTYAIVQERVDTLIPLVSMLNRREIIGYVRNKTDWDVGVKQIENYMRKANEALKENLAEHRKTACEKSLNNRANLYKKSFQDGDWKTCDSIQDKIDKLCGVDKIEEKQVVNITFGKNED